MPFLIVNLSASCTRVRVVGLVSCDVVRDFDIEVHLSLSRDVRLLDFVRLAILDRNVVEIVLRGLGELENRVTTFVLLEVSRTCLA